MAMSSYMVNSKYVDPKFPPCEEYSQNNYIPEQSSDYYSPSQDTDFQHPGIYPRSNYTEQPFSCNTVQDSTVQPRGHVHERSSHSSPFSAQTEQGPPVQVAGPRTCGQQQNTKSQNGIQAKQPAVVYPWMKKVHVTTGKISTSSPSLTHQLRPAPLEIIQCNIYGSLWKASPITQVINFYSSGNRPLGERLKAPEYTYWPVVMGLKSAANLLQIQFESFIISRSRVLVYPLKVWAPG